MRLVVVSLGVVLLALPASAGTTLDGVQSELETLGPVNDGFFLIGAYEKATLCSCSDSGDVGHLTFAKFERISPITDLPVVKFQALCSASEFNPATGETTGPPLPPCRDFEVLAR